VSRPSAAGGGFVRVADNLSTRHKFMRTPDMNEQCIACHGGSIGHDFQGLGDGIEADVHAQLGMECMDCHSAGEIHGDGGYAGGPGHFENRYQVASMPSCNNIACHGNDIPNAFHTQHVSGPGTDLACQVCHSQPYKNCTSCHAGTGSDPSVLAFKIGRNPLPEERHYRYAVLRHSPVVDDTYAAWGLDRLPGFDDEPTWRYAAPHNIKRLTERTSLDGETADCKACHNAPVGGPDDPFLRASDLTPGDSAANQDLVVRSDQPFDME
jgi:thiosulfate/3-mercaptopyruvate sulfurtransferase